MLETVAGIRAAGCACMRTWHMMSVRLVLGAQIFSEYLNNVFVFFHLFIKQVTTVHH
jgi:hypothetical protein